jgi:hypothetical protein
MDSVTISNFQSQLGMGTLSCNGSIRDLNDPVLNLSVSAETNLNEVKGFFGWDSLAVCDGQISAQSFIRGKIAFQEADSTFDWSQLHLNGKAQVTEGSFQWAASNGLFKNINGVFLLNGSDARVEQLNFNLNDNNCSFSGDFYSVIPYFTSDNSALTIQANLYSNRLDLEKLLTAAGNTESDMKLALPSSIQLHLTAQIDQFLRKWHSTDFSPSTQHGQWRSSCEFRFITIERWAVRINVPRIIEQHRHSAGFRIVRQFRAVVSHAEQHQRKRYGTG